MLPSLKIYLNFYVKLVASSLNADKSENPVM